MYINIPEYKRQKKSNTSNTEYMKIKKEGPFLKTVLSNNWQKKDFAKGWS